MTLTFPQRICLGNLEGEFGSMCPHRKDGGDLGNIRLPSAYSFWLKYALWEGELRKKEESLCTQLYNHGHP